MSEIKRPAEPFVCSECGERATQIRESFRQTPGRCVAALHTRHQVWLCGHESRQWWFERWLGGADTTEILAAGDGLAEHNCWSEYKEAHR